MHESAAELRYELEALPCALCTRDISNKQLEEMSKEIDQMVNARYEDIPEFKEKREEYWWYCLERSALENGAKYYEDLDLKEE